MSRVFELISKEAERQSQCINLIASENQTSTNVLRALGSVFTNKYAEGYPGKRWYGGCKFTDEVEAHAIRLAKQLFGSGAANVQPHSGTSANIAAYMTLINPGDKVLAFNLSHGGHLSHGAAFNFSGKFYNFVHYGVRQDDGLIDVDQIKRAFEEHKDIKLLVAGASSYPRAIDFEPLAQLARDNGALFMADAAHISGLVAAKLHPDPVPHADLVTMSTHKTIRGPRGGMVVGREEWASKLDRAVFPGSQGGPLEHVIAAKAIMLEEALEPAFREYIAEVIASAQALAAALSEISAKRFRVLTGGTDNHMVMIDVTGDSTLNGKRAEELLERQNIFINKNFIPYDTLPVTVTSGIRLGTPTLVTQGATRADMPRLAALIDRALSEGDVKAEVAAFMEELRQRTN
ncbi:MAG: serine hydroxymethyltransferase [Planctomycetes bacterium]|nr:serine hydroxymethyltransferase [Planctomycetota bacterium]